MINWSRSLLHLAAALSVGCASVNPEGDLSEVTTWVSERVPHARHRDAPGLVDEILSAPLSVESATRIALQNNPGLRATYEDLGFAQAEVIAAGRLTNPVLAASARPFAGGPSGTNIEADLAQNFLQLLMLPSRKRLAATQFEAVKRRVAHRVLTLVAEVESAFYRAQGASQRADILAVASEAASTSAALAERYYEAGNLSALDLAREQAQSEQIRADWIRVSVDAVRAREHLVRLLGLRDSARVVVPAQMGEALHAFPEVETLEALAMEQRFDLAALEREIEVRGDAARLEKRFRWIPFLEIGVSSEREPDGGNDWVVGPSLALEIPIFDQGQAGILRAEAAFRKSEGERDALAVAIHSQVREARAIAGSARKRAELYRQRILPLREEVTALSLRRTHFMLESPFLLLAAKREEVIAFREYVDALEDFWVARSMLATAVGGRLPVIASGVEPAVGPAPRRAPSRQPHDSHHPHGGH